MVIYKLDFLSPINNIYFKGKTKHTGTLSIVISIISIISIIILIILFLKQLFIKSNPLAYFYNKFYDKVGEFPFNSSSMFTYIHIGKKPVDFQAVTIFVLQTSYNYLLLCFYQYQSYHFFHISNVYSVINLNSLYNL